MIKVHRTLYFMQDTVVHRVMTLLEKTAYLACCFDRLWQSTCWWFAMEYVCNKLLLCRVHNVCT